MSGAAADGSYGGREGPRVVRFETADGAPLEGSVFEPAGTPRASVLVNSAMAVRRDYYGAFAAHLAMEGFRVLTYDYRGIGGSRPASLRGFRAEAHDWGERDAAAALDRLASETDPGPLLLVGHSIGGQIAGLMPNRERLAGLLLVAAQSGDWRLWPFPDKLAMAALWHVALPVVVGLAGYAPGRLGLGQDVPAGVVLEWARWGRRRGYLLGGDGARWRDGFRSVRAPIVALGFTDDRYAPERTIDGLLQLYESAPREHRRIRPSDAGARRIGHFGFFRPAFRDTLWRQAAAWLTAAAGTVTPPSSSARATPS